MRITPLATISLLALAACSPRVPDSAAGVGAVAPLPQAAAVQAQSLDSGNDAAADIAAQTSAALGLNSTATAAQADLSQPLSALSPTAAPAAPAALDPTAPVVAATSGVAADVVVADGTQVEPTLSDEQNFTAVSERESIASDAARIEANRAQYVTIAPTDLPPRPDGTGASIVAFALATNNAVGVQLYNRSGLAAQARFESACAKYGPDDNAQQVFLDNGGPEKDRYGMDPDGDGFACYWDPTPFRAARAGAPAEVTTYEVVETPGEG